MPEYKPVTHCIFDMDGLLLDTEGIYKKLITDVLTKYGKEYTDEVRAKVMGTTERDTLRILLTELAIPVSFEEFAQNYKKDNFALLSDAKLLPGAERLIQHLHKSGVPICLATSSGKESVKLKLTNHAELFSLFHHMVMGSSDPEVINGKPNPDIFLIAAKRFDDNPSPEKCLVFEDSLNGVKAANAAGMQVVMVPDPIISNENRALATVALGSLEEFRPEQFDLPAF